MTRVAVDIGQGGTRIRTVDNAGQATSHVLSIGGSGAPGALERAIESAVASQAVMHPTIDAVAVGATGVFGAPPDVGDLVDTLQRDFGVRLCILADDGVTNLLGARGGRSGVVVAAGTGVVAVGFGIHRAVRVDGVGAGLGDEGSGWWVGRRGLIAAFSAIDGRDGGSHELLEYAEAVYGPIHEMARTIAISPSKEATVARFAECVADAARSGAGIAQTILGEAGVHLARACVAAADGADLTSTDFEWSLTGGLSGAVDLLEPTMSTAIAARAPGAALVPAFGDALDGAFALFDTDTDVFGTMVRTYRT